MMGALAKISGALRGAVMASLVFFSVLSHAEITPVNTWIFRSSHGSPSSPITGTNPGSVCAAGISAVVPPTYSYSGVQQQGATWSCRVTWTFNGGGEGEGGFLQSLGAQCPANSTNTGAVCVCNTNLIEQDGQCVDPEEACGSKAGTSSIINMTIAWQRSPTTGTTDWYFPTRLPAGGHTSMCSGGCRVDIDAFSAANNDTGLGGGYVSQVPNAQGMYRRSMDFTGTWSGASCTVSEADAPVNPNSSKDPPCPGFVGEVNHTKVCVSTEEKPITEGELPNRDVVKGEAQVGNPPAGEKPAEGEGSGSGGSGRTPSNGDGGSNGGPSSAAGTGGGAGGGGAGAGTGYGEKKEGKEQLACGAPGQPKCAIDEGNMPKASDAFTGSGDIFKQAKDQQDAFFASVTEKGDKDTSWGVNLSWVEHASCQPWNLGTMVIMGQSFNLEVDICVIEPYVVAVMNFLWAVATFFLTIGMVFRVMSKGGE